MEPRKKFKRMVPQEIKVETLRIDDVVCGTTKCSDGFHCFSQKKTSLRKFGHERACKECGVELVDWPRIHKNDLNDTNYVFKELQTEIIRHVFWHTPITRAALTKTYMRGSNQTRERAKKLLTQRIGKYNEFMDGRQTPMGQDELVNYAQHATATCCRKCLEAWHNIPLKNTLTNEQLDFCVELVMKYIGKRVKGLKAEGLPEESVQKILSNENA